MASSNAQKTIKNPLLRTLHSHWYFLLLPVFFVTHGLYENVELIPIHELLMLLGILWIIGLLVYWIFGKIFRNFKKSALFTFLFLLISLFFGVAQDFAEHQLPDSFVSRLTFISILAFLLLGISFLVIRKTNSELKKIPVYLNLLFAIYILVDIAGIINKTRKHSEIDALTYHESLNLRVCDTCVKPSVYLVLLDEYAGTAALKEYFNYNNRGFEDSLKQLGFHVVERSNSNYYYTVYSMASMLNLDYIPGFSRHGVEDDEGYHNALAMIKNSVVVHHFVDEGYGIRNYSYFDLDGFPAKYKNDYLPGKINLILHKTMYVRILSQVLKKLGAGRPLVFATGDWEEQYVLNNQDMMDRVLRENDGSIPSFNYIHLMMPHDPFTFNSKGERIRKWVRASSSNPEEVDSAYLEYLIYTNKKIYQFIEHLKSKTKGNAVILLMSDHAYRGFERKGKMNLLYSNLNAVYLPGMQYENWGDGMSNVNQFRLLFSALFHNNLPLLKNELVP